MRVGDSGLATQCIIGGINFRRSIRVGGELCRDNATQPITCGNGSFIERSGNPGGARHRRRRNIVVGIACRAPTVVRGQVRVLRLGDPPRPIVGVQSAGQTSCDVILILVNREQTAALVIRSFHLATQWVGDLRQELLVVVPTVHRTTGPYPAVQVRIAGCISAGILDGSDIAQIIEGVDGRKRITGSVRPAVHAGHVTPIGER